MIVADETKQVEMLGRFPLPVEVIPPAAPLVIEVPARTRFHPPRFGSTRKESVASPMR
jgi:ribose 5-phosphate isomerase